MQRTEGPHISAIVGGTKSIDQHLRVKLDPSNPRAIVVADDEAWEGTHLNGLDRKPGSHTAYYDRKQPGTTIFVAAGTILAGDTLSTATLGRVQAGTGGAEPAGTALTGGGAGDLIEARETFT